MTLLTTYHDLLSERRRGRDIEDTLRSLSSQADLNRMRGEPVNTLEVAIYASMLSLPLNSAELEPEDGALDLLRDLTDCAQVIGNDLKRQLETAATTLDLIESSTAAPHTRTAGRTFNAHILELILRLSRWRAGAVPLPGRLKSNLGVHPIQESAQVLNGKKPDEGTFLTLTTRRSQRTQLTPQQKNIIFHGRLHLTESRHVNFWARTLQEWMNDKTIRGNLATSSVPHSPLGTMLLAEPLRTAYASGPLAGTPEQPVGSHPPEVHAELAELMEFHGGTQLALSLIMGPPAVIPEDTGAQRRLLNWLHLCQRLLGINGDQALRHTKLPNPPEADPTPSAEDTLLSDAALIHWVRLSDPGMKTDQPATKALQHLLYKSPEKNTVTEAWLRRSVRLSEEWLALLLSGDAAPKDHFYTQSLSDYIIRGIATAIRDIPDHARLLATFIVQRNELSTYMLRRAKKMPAMTRLTDPELHLPWTPMSPQTREKRISELALLLAEDRQ